MDTKRLTVQVKDAAKGEVSAVFATFNAIDSDGDVTLPGAFTDGAKVRISAYNHKSWEGALPVGKGTIRTTDTEAIMDGQFFMDTTHGRDAFLTVKAMSEDDLQEWSYGYDAADFSFGEHDGKRVRFLRKQIVHEVSPVLLGAGVGTRTLAAKSRKTGFKRIIGPHETPVVMRAWDGPGVVSAIPDDASPSDLRTVYAWVDNDGDPEAKSSYKFPHHHGVGGPANMRACMAAIAALNGARGGSDIPDGEKQAVYEHLAAHMRDGDREPPELRTAPGGALKFHDELIEGLAGLSGLVDSASRVVALRAEKGKSLSRVNAEVLEWIADDLKRLNALLTTPYPSADEPLADDEIRTLLAAVARVNGI